MEATKGEVIISGNVSDSELHSDNDVELEPKSSSKSETTLTTETSVEIQLKKILDIWKDFMISYKDFLRSVPKDNNWNNDVLLNGRVFCPLEVCRIHKIFIKFVEIFIFFYKGL